MLLPEKEHVGKIAAGVIVDHEPMLILRNEDRDRSGMRIKQSPLFRVLRRNQPYLQILAGAHSVLLNVERLKRLLTDNRHFDVSRWCICVTGMEGST